MVPALVIRVIDGDTIEVRIGHGRHSVRLLGVDAPETNHPTRSAEWGGRRATRFVKQRLQGRTIYLERDPLASDRDRYNRLLRYVHLDGGKFNAEIIREGFARAYRGFRYTLKGHFVRLETAAKRAGKTTCFAPPFLSRKALRAAVVIAIGVMVAVLAQPAVILPYLFLALASALVLVAALWRWG